MVGGQSPHQTREIASERASHGVEGEARPPLPNLAGGANVDRDTPEGVGERERKKQHRLSASNVSCKTQTADQADMQVASDKGNKDPLSGIVSRDGRGNEAGISNAVEDRSVLRLEMQRFIHETIADSLNSPFPHGDVDDFIEGAEVHLSNLTTVDMADTTALRADDKGGIHGVGIGDDSLKDCGDCLPDRSSKSTSVRMPSAGPHAQDHALDIDVEARSDVSSLNSLATCESISLTTARDASQWPSETTTMTAQTTQRNVLDSKHSQHGDLHAEIMMSQTQPRHDGTIDSTMPQAMTTIDGSGGTVEIWKALREQNPDIACPKPRRARRRRSRDQLRVHAQHVGATERRGTARGASQTSRPPPLPSLLSSSSSATKHQHQRGHHHYGDGSRGMNASERKNDRQQSNAWSPATIAHLPESSSRKPPKIWGYFGADLPGQAEIVMLEEMLRVRVGAGACNFGAPISAASSSPSATRAHRESMERATGLSMDEGANATQDANIGATNGLFAPAGSEMNHKSHLDRAHHVAVRLQHILRRAASAHTISSTFGRHPLTRISSSGNLVPSTTRDSSTWVQRRVYLTNRYLIISADDVFGTLSRKTCASRSMHRNCIRLNPMKCAAVPTRDIKLVMSGLLPTIAPSSHEERITSNNVLPAADDGAADTSNDCNLPPTLISVRTTRHLFEFTASKSSAAVWTRELRKCADKARNAWPFLAIPCIFDAPYKGKRPCIAHIDLARQTLTITLSVGYKDSSHSWFDGSKQSEDFEGNGGAATSGHFVLGQGHVFRSCDGSMDLIIVSRVHLTELHGVIGWSGHGSSVVRIEEGAGNRQWRTKNPKSDHRRSERGNSARKGGPASRSRFDTLHEVDQPTLLRTGIAGGYCLHMRTGIEAEILVMLLKTCARVARLEDSGNGSPIQQHAKRREPHREGNGQKIENATHGAFHDLQKPVMPSWTDAVDAVDGKVKGVGRKLHVSAATEHDSTPIDARQADYCNVEDPLAFVPTAVAAALRPVVVARARVRVVTSRRRGGLGGWVSGMEGISSNTTSSSSPKRALGHPQWIEVSPFGDLIGFVDDDVETDGFLPRSEKGHNIGKSAATFPHTDRPSPKVNSSKPPGRLACSAQSIRGSNVFIDSAGAVWHELSGDACLVLSFDTSVERTTWVKALGSHIIGASDCTRPGQPQNTTLSQPNYKGEVTARRQRKVDLVHSVSQSTIAPVMSTRTKRGGSGRRDALNSRCDVHRHGGGELSRNGVSKLALHDDHDGVTVEPMTPWERLRTELLSWTNRVDEQIQRRSSNSSILRDNGTDRSECSSDDWVILDECN